MSEQLGNGLRQIKLFLVDGSPAGIIAADIVNWTGKAMAGPRSRLGQLIRREEAERTGVYLLIGPDPDRTGGLKAYVGEADNIRKRLIRHEAEDSMNFFDRVAFVVSKDENSNQGSCALSGKPAHPDSQGGRRGNLGKHDSARRAAAARGRSLRHGVLHRAAADGAADPGF